MIILIKGELVEQVETYKYLGITIDQNLNWQTHASLIYKKANKRMFFLRKLKYFNIDSTLLSLFYKSAIESILTFCITAWGGNLKNCDKMKLDRLIKRLAKIVKNSFPLVDTLHDHLCLTKIMRIKKDPTYPLAPQIKTSLHSNRHNIIY